MSLIKITLGGLDGIVAKADEVKAAIRRAFRPDPYSGHDIAADKLVAARTYERPENVRARKVAALRAELDRPMPFPSVGRDDRVLKQGGK